MIHTDRNYNEEMKKRRQEKIDDLEKEMDELIDRMLDDPAFCTEKNIGKLNNLAIRIAIMRGEMIYNVNCNDF